MITYILNLNEEIEKKIIIKLFKEKFSGAKHDSKNKSYEMTTAEYRIVYFYDEYAIIIIPRKIKNSVVAPDDFIALARSEKIIRTAKAMFSITKESSFFDMILKNYGTSIEKLANEDSDTVLITKEVEGIDYLIHFNGKDEKLNILVSDIENNKKYNDILNAIINAIANDI